MDTYTLHRRTHSFTSGARAGYLRLGRFSSARLRRAVAALAIRVNTAIASPGFSSANRSNAACRTPPRRTPSRGSARASFVSDDDSRQHRRRRNRRRRRRRTRGTASHPPTAPRGAHRDDDSRLRRLRLRRRFRSRRRFIFHVFERAREDEQRRRGGRAAGEHPRAGRERTNDAKRRQRAQIVVASVALERAPVARPDVRVAKKRRARLDVHRIGRGAVKRVGAILAGRSVSLFFVGFCFAFCSLRRRRRRNRSSLSRTSSPRSRHSPRRTSLEGRACLCFPSRARTRFARTTRRF